MSSAKGTALEATTGFAGATLDTLDIAAGLARDVAGNAASTDAVANAPLFTHAGQSVIDLGSYGKLIAPVQVEGNWYYYWDRSADGSSANSGSLNGGTDYATHNVLDGIFTQDINGTAGGSGNTTDVYRYATLNGVRVALPTANGGLDYLGGINAYQNGTLYSNDGDPATSTFNELLAIWDAYNGTGTGTSFNGTPAGWQADSYWSATPSASGHADVYLHDDGFVFDIDDFDVSYVALQVL